MRSGIVSSLVVVLSLVAGCSTGAGDCLCEPCTFGGAVTLTVTDARTGGPITTFVVDAMANGFGLGQPDTCSPEQRTGNACSFGNEAGLYHLVVTAPGYETREVVVRQPDQGSGDLCCRACLTSQEVTVALDALEGE